MFLIMAFFILRQNYQKIKLITIKTLNLQFNKQIYRP